MPRDLFINGETMVLVKGRSDSAIANLAELGLAVDDIKVTPQHELEDVTCNAWGKVPFDQQVFGAYVDIQMTLVQYDNDILDVCIQESMGGTLDIGKVARAGARLGNNQPRFAPGPYSAGNHYIGLNLSSPVGAKPWRFLYTFLTRQPYTYPLGTRRSMVTLSWRCIPYTQDPYQAGAGALGQILFDHTLDT